MDPSEELTNPLAEPPFGMTDHNVVYLVPIYNPALKETKLLMILMVFLIIILIFL